MQRTQHGDVAAFSALYDHLAPLVYSICLRVISDPELALQASQETLLTIWQDTPSVDFARETIEVCASTLAHRRAVDCVRSTEDRRQREPLSADSTLGAWGFETQKGADVGDVDCVSKALSRLSTS